VPRIALILSIPALALGLAACGDNTKDLEKNAAKELSSRGYPQAKVNCPSDVNTDKGKTFTCTVTGAPIKEVTYKVVDDKGNVTIESVK
jgi:hypothetical protein